MSRLNVRNCAHAPKQINKQIERQIEVQPNPQAISHRTSLWIVAAALLCSACAGGVKSVAVDAQRFPVPVMLKTPVRMGIHLDDTLRTYQYSEEIEKSGTWEVNLGAAQLPLFSNLGQGVFEHFELVDNTSAPQLDGVLKPNITTVQFALPSQTRSDYYEVWIRYEFQLYDREGNHVTDWVLPAYGKANRRDFGNRNVGLQEAALAACRDAMAFFSLNFAKEPGVYQWLAAGKPLVPAAASPAGAANAATPASSSSPAPATPSTGAGT